MFFSVKRLCSAALLLIPCLPASGALSEDGASSDSRAAEVAPAQTPGVSEKKESPGNIPDAGQESPESPDASRLPDKAKIFGGSYETLENGNLMLLSNHPQIVIGEARIEAEKISYHLVRREADAEGEVKINLGAMRVLALDATAKLPLDGIPTIRTGKMRMGMIPGYIEAEEFCGEFAATSKDSRSNAVLKNVTVYYQEPDFFSLSVDAGKITCNVDNVDGDREDVRGDAEITVEDAVIRIAGIPVFYLPSYSQRGLYLPPVEPWIRAGQKNNLGIFLRTTTYFTGLRGAWSDFRPGLLLDGYTKAGVLVGPALKYDTSKQDVFESVMRGGFQGGWINDNSDPGTDDYGRKIDSDRAFFTWNHKQTISDTLELSASVNYWSDTSVVRDFRSQDFNENQRPDSYVELVYPDSGFYASLFSRFRPNDFSDVQQRLPEVRFDMVPREIFDTGIYQHLNVAFSYSEERASPENPLPAGNAAGLESPRFDAYYGLTRAIKPNDWLTVTPVAGVRSTTYFDTIDSGDPYTRVLPQLGFDLQLLAQGQWDVNSDTWNIHGLRHQVRPVMQYRWIPAADKGISHIPQIDRFGFTTYPPPIDLSQKRYADDMWEQQVFRYGFENLFQTRADDYGSRDLAWLNIYNDIRDVRRAGERTLSDIYTQIGFAPAYWLDVEFYNRLDPYAWNSREISARIEVHDGDRWRLWLGIQYLTDIAPTNQYFWGFEYEINSDYSVRAQWRYDAKVGELTEQLYGFSQRLGNTWSLEYTIGYRRNAREDDDFSFGIGLRMNTF